MRKGFIIFLLIAGISGAVHAADRTSRGENSSRSTVLNTNSFATNTTVNTAPVSSRAAAQQITPRTQTESPTSLRGAVGRSPIGGGSATEYEESPTQRPLGGAPRPGAPAETKFTLGGQDGGTARSATTRNSAERVATTAPVHSRAATSQVSSRTLFRQGFGGQAATVARNAALSPTGTRTGAAYEQCKSAYFACMDQFCAIKNANFQRCSCSDRIYDLIKSMDVMQEASGKLTEFTENLDTVGMTAAQVQAMRKASEGEDALTKDKSASKALLNAIMNSIKGEDASVGGKYSDLNSINIRMDSGASFGNLDDGQAIAAYNGTNLYTAIYGRCRAAVRPDCSDAALQRAVTAYLMAIEQDCNTVQKMVDDNKKKLVSNVREGGALLELARVQNRQAHNALDAAACISEVESAVLSDQVCGENYRKCLDNGQFIDITTGRPLEGVVQFYKLETLLTFAMGRDMADQKLAQMPANRQFVESFEKRVKQFAEPALDKCVEIRKEVWADFLDRAMLDIHYAQRAKVDDIKMGCMDFVSACYMNGERTLTAPMKELMNTSLYLQPDYITLNNQICEDYVQACDNMFTSSEAGGIIAQYITFRKDADVESACKAVVRQCFENFGGGLNYPNFYNYTYGLFPQGRAFDWFSLKQYKCTGCNSGGCTGCAVDEDVVPSECGRQLLAIESCKNYKNENGDTVETIFGGFVKATIADGSKVIYARLKSNGELEFNKINPFGVATEVYNKINNDLANQCAVADGGFVKITNTEILGNYKGCSSNFGTGDFKFLSQVFQIGTPKATGFDGIENMCPLGYSTTIDIESWGICSCWENGGRRSGPDGTKGGTLLKCDPGFVNYDATATACPCTAANSACIKTCHTVLASPVQRDIFTVPGTNDAYKEFVGKICPKKVTTTATGSPGTPPSGTNPINSKICDKFGPEYTGGDTEFKKLMELLNN